MDTTLRDGEQTQGVSFSPEEKLNIAKVLLEDAEVCRVEVASARVSRGEEKAVKKIAEWASGKGFIKRVEVLGFVDGQKSVDWIFGCGISAMNLLVKGSLLHLEKQLRKSTEQHIADIKETVEYAESKGIRVNVFLEDWSNGMKESKEYVMLLVGALAKMPVERIYLTDTLGVLTPNETRKFVTEMIKMFPTALFEFHGHNDYGLAVANSLAAVEAGCKGVHVTVNGLGERAGNASLDEVAVVLNDKTMQGCYVSEKNLAKLSRIVEAFSGKRIAANKPVSGSNVFTQTAGIHADGDKKAGLYESALRPERFGRKRQYALGKLSGKASIEQNLSSLGLNISEEEKKKVLQKVIELGDKKKVVTTEDLPYIVSDVLKSPKQNMFKIIKCEVSSGLGKRPRALLALKTNNENYTETAEGDGGYDAVMNALRKIARRLSIDLPTLIDYEVRIPPGGKTDALVETTITWQTKEKSFSTTGIDSDQTIAAVKATEKMLNAIVHLPFEPKT